MKVLGVLAGDDLSDALGIKWCATADQIYAADGGADRVVHYGFTPNIVIGDMDSVQGAHNASEWILDPSEEATDCDKLLRLAAHRGHRSMTLIGAEGNQLDHTIATLHSAARSAILVRLALRTGIGWVLRSNETVTVETTPDARVSLLPLSACRGVSLIGVHWPLYSVEFDATRNGSISNRATEPQITAVVGDGAAFLFVGYPESELPRWNT